MSSISTERDCCNDWGLQVAKRNSRRSRGTESAEWTGMCQTSGVKGSRSGWAWDQNVYKKGCVKDYENGKKVVERVDANIAEAAEGVSATWEREARRSQLPVAQCQSQGWWLGCWGLPFPLSRAKIPPAQIFSQFPSFSWLSASCPRVQRPGIGGLFGGDKSGESDMGVDNQPSSLSPKAKAARGH